MIKRKEIILTAALVLFASIFPGCSGLSDKNVNTPDSANSEASVTTSEPEVNEDQNHKPVIRIGVLKGPSSLGTLQIMEKNENGTAENSYEFTLAGAPQDIQSKLISGELDIAAIPINMAAALYNKTDKSIKAIGVGTLGVLYMLTKGEEITSFADMEGKTVYATGQGATPEYVLQYLIDKNGLSGKVTVEYKAEHAELAALMATGNVSVAMLPQPFVTTVVSKNEDVKVVLDLNEEWRKASGGTELAMTCIVARKEFIENNKAAVDKFIEEYKQSKDFVNSNVEDAAKLSGKFDIIPEAVALEAIPKCGIVLIAGNEMKTSVNPVLEVLMDANPQSVGGALPDDEFYSIGQE